MAAERSNNDWVQDLRISGPAGDAARADLRVALVLGLRRVLTMRAVDPSLAEDFAHEALLRVQVRLDSFRGDSRFVSWSMAIATRVAFDELRHQRWKDTSLEALTRDAATPVDFADHRAASADKLLERERVLTHLRAGIDNDLTPRQRQALLAELRGLPHVEIAAAMAMNRNALYKLTHDARRKLKATLEAAGITAAEAQAAFDDAV